MICTVRSGLLVPVMCIGLMACGGSGGEANSTTTPTLAPTPTPTPTPTPIVALLLQAEDYVDFSDSDPGNTGNSYRSDDVDIEATNDAGGGFHVGWTATGEWLEYDVNLGEGEYKVTTRVASQVSTGGYTLLLDGQIIGSDSVSNTGGWQVFVTHYIATIAVDSGGTQTLRLNVTGSDFNINWIEFTPLGADDKLLSAPSDEPREGKIDGVTVWQLPNSPNGDKPDQCWLAVGSDADGEIYISGHDHINNSMLYRMHQQDNVLRWVGDARTASEAVDNWLPGESAEKFHTRPLHHNGQVYVATLDSSSMDFNYLNTRGFHWYGYDILDNEFLDLSVSEPDGVGAPTVQIVSIQKDEKNNLLYGMSLPDNRLLRYDIARNETTILGSPVEWSDFVYTNRFMWVDSRGRVYISAGSSRAQWNRGESPKIFNNIWYYDPISGFGQLDDFSLQGPNAMEVGQWDRANEILYTADDQGNIYRFVDADGSWSFIGKPNFIGVAGTPKIWVFQLSADGEKIYIGVSDSISPNAIWEYDIASGQASELAKISDLDNVSATQQFITGYDSWDSRGSFYISSFTMYNGVNVYMLGVNPVRIKASTDPTFELVEVGAKASDAGVSLSRTGATTESLEVLYEVSLYDTHDSRLNKVLGQSVIAAGQLSVELTFDSLTLSPSVGFSRAEFSIVPDGNDYVTGNVHTLDLMLP
jgi:hypothetical protein